MFRRISIAIALATLTLGLPTVASAKKSKDECKSVKPEVELKMATLAPAGSEWSKQFSKWSDDALEESDCRLLLKWYFNSANEMSILDDLKSGAKHGAAMTATGLGTINKNILLLQLPGAFENWGELDSARNTAKAALETAFSNAGFILAGWGDVGAGKIMSTDAPIRRPSDLNGKVMFQLPGDVIGPKLLSVVPGVQAKQLPLAELSTHLGKDVQVITTPPFAAEQLQWAPKINHVTMLTPAFGIGALVFKKEKIESLPGDLKAVLLKTGKVYGETLTTKIRQLDADAFGRLKNNKNKVELTAEDKKAWDEVFTKARRALKSEFDKALYEMIVPAAKQ
jgi:TRAP-type C4-dicarboxylate transport system substrate-binding protein